MKDDQMPEEAKPNEELLSLARKVSALAPILKSSLYVMQLQGDDVSSAQLAIIALNAAGHKHVGPCWGLGEFMNDLTALGKLVHSEEELMDQSASGIATIFGGPGPSQDGGP
jgi:hypothetical protein